MTDHLLRSLAPISDTGWKLLDDEARERLTPALAARKLVDFSGPKGWSYSATNLGRVDRLASAPREGVTGARRRVLPLVEMRAEFEISLEELRAGDRGAEDVELEPLGTAAHRMALAENTAVFHGWPDCFQGITEVSPHDPVPLGASADDFPRPVAVAVETLLCEGVGGPYALALGGEQYTRVAQTAEHGGYPLREHLQKILDGPIVWAHGVRGAVVLSLRGEDFLFESGQDLSVGYAGHDGQNVRLYLEESFSFRAVTPEAAVVLTA
jgi:uncharacterized linocin/CFP29 family protein